MWRRRFSYGQSALAIAALLAATASTQVLAAPGAGSRLVVTTNDGILDIVMHADAVVKSVMALLALASIVTWTLWFIKLRELRGARQCLQQDIRMLSTATSLDEARGVRYRATQQMVAIAADELKQAGAAPTHRQIEGVEERVAVQFPMVEARAIHHMLWGTNILASIGAISPFVGLAGTVWGIMNSFLGISRAQSSSLAVVAPGIAEALLATAIGLAAAIPAVLIYNSLSRSMAGFRRLLNEAAVLSACVLSRDSERAEAAAAGPGGAQSRTSSTSDRVVVLAHSDEAR